MKGTGEPGPRPPHQMLDHLDELETLVALKEAADEIERGEDVDAAEMMTRLRKRLGVGKPAR